MSEVNAEQFTVTRYVCGLEKTIVALSRHAKIAFSVWCADYLVRWIQEPLKELGESGILSQIVDFMKQQETNRDAVDSVLFRTFASHLEDFDFGSLQSSPATEQGLDVVLIQAVTAVLFALQVCKDDSAECAARTAECVLNAYDRVLSQRLHVDSNSQEVFNHPTMRAELARQNSAVAQLSQAFVSSSGLPSRPHI